MNDAAESARIRALRPDKPAVDPWRPLDVLVEEERFADGRVGSSVTVFLAGSECPFTCVFCDLWRYTLEGPTPAGAIPRQVELALDSLDEAASVGAIKLYNASNFFDRRAVPPGDLPAVARRLRGFQQVVVECHPRLVGAACQEFAALLDGRLEVAMGLETVHPEALPRLNKQMDLEDFADAASRLRGAGIGVRAFVLLSPPFVPHSESVKWTIRTVSFALEHGADVVSIIPLRIGHGEMERLEAEGWFHPPSLEMLEEVLVRTVETQDRAILADLWDADSLAACPDCRDDRLAHLRAMNRTGRIGVVVDCPTCGQQERGRI